MTSFATHRLRVHDTARPAHRRLSALRTCLTQFAPYGFRATYDHLCRSAGVPVRLEEDPGALVWAVEELHAAREIWRAEQAAWEARRRVQKGEGRRTTDPPQPTRLLSCPDPEFHPAGPLPALMPRIMRARTDRPAVSCPLCEADHGTVERHDGHGFHRTCARCGVSLGPLPGRLPAGAATEREARWRAVWNRTARDGAQSATTDGARP
ncbi:hypothetical protein ABZ891_11900 [Streptomyces sp. NPDC047023]|uniref:hypothetical protein n=1 Tax=Streptomyces sp. NPDC047023 TaxID=3155139 RepID=UPI00340710A7